MMNALKMRAESYNEWASNVNEALEAKISNKRSKCLPCDCLNTDLILEPWQLCDM